MTKRRRREIDLGTPEAVKKKIDMGLSRHEPTTALYRLWKAGWINENQRYAGESLAALAQNVRGKSTPQAVDPTRITGGPTGDTNPEDEARWRMAYAMLSRAGMWVKYEVDRVCLADEYPVWAEGRARPLRAWDTFRRGMVTLERWADDCWRKPA